MEVKHITIEVNVSALPGHEMPEEQVILDAVINRLFDFEIKGSAVIDTVLITGINGHLTHELD
jgi:hypothetical protein